MTNMTNKTAKTAATILLATGLLTLTACSSSSNKHAGNIGSIRSNPTPAMHTLAQRSSDRINKHAYTFDTDLRAMQEDIDYILHLDRPSRLHKNVKPY